MTKPPSFIDDVPLSPDDAISAAKKRLERIAAMPTGNALTHAAALAYSIDVPALLATVADLRARNEALTHERNLWKKIAEDASHSERARAESLERRNHDLAQDLRRADAVIAYAVGQGADLVKRPDFYSSAKSEAIERHRARRAGEEGEG